MISLQNEWSFAEPTQERQPIPPGLQHHMVRGVAAVPTVNMNSLVSMSERQLLLENGME